MSRASRETGGVASPRAPGRGRPLEAACGEVGGDLVEGRLDLGGGGRPTVGSFSSRRSTSRSRPSAAVPETAERRGRWVTTRCMVSSGDEAWNGWRPVAIS